MDTTVCVQNQSFLPQPKLGTGNPFASRLLLLSESTKKDLRLPVELNRAILELVNGPRDLANAAAASHSLQVEAERILYNKPKVHGRHVLQFCHSVIISARRAARIQDLSMNVLFFDLQATREEIVKTLQFTFGLLVNLRGLQLHLGKPETDLDDGFLDSVPFKLVKFSTNADITQPLLNFLASQPQLTELHQTCSRATWQPSEAPKLNKHALDNIKIVQMPLAFLHVAVPRNATHMLLDLSNEDNEKGATLRLAHVKNLKSLTFVSRTKHLIPPRTNLQVLANCAPGVEYLGLRNCQWTNYEPDIELGRALQALGEMKTLVLEYKRAYLFPGDDRTLRAGEMARFFLRHGKSLERFAVYIDEWFCYKRAPGGYTEAEPSQILGRDYWKTA